MTRDEGDIRTALGLFMDTGKVEVEAVEFSEAEKEALDDIQGVFDDLEEGLTLSLRAVRELRKRFKQCEADEVEERSESALDVLGPVAARIAANREANTIKGE